MSDKIKKSLFSKLRNYFFAGMVVLIPIVITIYLTVIIIRLSSRVLPKELNPNHYLPIDIPGIEILITIILVTVIGWISLSFLGKKLLEAINNLLKRIPILRTIYSAIGTMTETFTSSGDNKKKGVAIIEYPRKGIWVVGFVTKDNRGEISKKTNEELINVFVPTTPNPTSGFLLMVPKKDVIYLDMSFEEASKFIVSAGTSS